VKEVELIEVGSMTPLKDNETTLFSATPVAMSSGSVELTTGKPTVVKLHTLLAASEAPDDAFAPTVIMAVYTELASSMDAGVKVAVVPEYVITPDTGVVPFITEKVEAVMVVGLMAALKEAEMAVVLAVPIPLSAGMVELTVGVGPGSLF
jgi:hypothetical protein